MDSPFPKQQLIRLLLDQLHLLGFSNTAKALENESQTQLEDEVWTRFRAAYLNAQWDLAETLALDFGIQYEEDLRKIKFWIRRQKYLERIVDAKSPQTPSSSLAHAPSSRPNTPSSPSMTSPKSNQCEQVLSILRNELLPLLPSSPSSSHNLHRPDSASRNPSPPSPDAPHDWFSLAELTRLSTCLIFAQTHTHLDARHIIPLYCHWSGAGPEGRLESLKQIESLVPRSLSLVPHGRLSILIQQALKYQEAKLMSMYGGASGEGVERLLPPFTAAPAPSLSPASTTMTPTSRNRTAREVASVFRTPPMEHMALSPSSLSHAMDALHHQGIWDLLGSRSVLGLANRQVGEINLFEDYTLHSLLQHLTRIPHASESVTKRPWKMIGSWKWDGAKLGGRKAVGTVGSLISPSLASSSSPTRDLNSQPVAKRSGSVRGEETQVRTNTGFATNAGSPMEIDVEDLSQQDKSVEGKKEEMVVTRWSPCGQLLVTGSSLGSLYVHRLSTSPSSHPSDPNVERKLELILEIPFPDEDVMKRHLPSHAFHSSSYSSNASCASSSSSLSSSQVNSSSTNPTSSLRPSSLPTSSSSTLSTTSTPKLASLVHPALRAPKGSGGASRGGDFLNHLPKAIVSIDWALIDHSTPNIIDHQRHHGVSAQGSTEEVGLDESNLLDSSPSHLLLVCYQSGVAVIELSDVYANEENRVVRQEDQPQTSSVPSASHAPSSASHAPSSASAPLASTSSMDVDDGVDGRKEKSSSSPPPLAPRHSTPSFAMAAFVNQLTMKKSKWSHGERMRQEEEKNAEGSSASSGVGSARHGTSSMMVDEGPGEDAGEANVGSTLKSGCIDWLSSAHWIYPRPPTRRSEQDKSRREEKGSDPTATLKGSDPTATLNGSEPTATLNGSLPFNASHPPNGHPSSHWDPPSSNHPSSHFDPSSSNHASSNEHCSLVNSGREAVVVNPTSFVFSGLDGKLRLVSLERAIKHHAHLVRMAIREEASDHSSSNGNSHLANHQNGVNSHHNGSTSRQNGSESHSRDHGSMGEEKRMEGLEGPFSQNSNHQNSNEGLSDPKSNQNSSNAQNSNHQNSSHLSSLPSAPPPSPLVKSWKMNPINDMVVTRSGVVITIHQSRSIYLTDVQSWLSSHPNFKKRRASGGGSASSSSNAAVGGAGARRRRISTSGHSLTHSGSGGTLVNNGSGGIPSTSNGKPHGNASNQGSSMVGVVEGGTSSVGTGMAQNEPSASSSIPPSSSSIPPSSMDLSSPSTAAPIQRRTLFVPGMRRNHPIDAPSFVPSSSLLRQEEGFHRPSQFNPGSQLHHASYSSHPYQHHHSSPAIDYANLARPSVVGHGQMGNIGNVQMGLSNQMGLLNQMGLSNPSNPSNPMGLLNQTTSSVQTFSHRASSHSSQMGHSSHPIRLTQTLPMQTSSSQPSHAASSHATLEASHAQANSSPFFSPFLPSHPAVKPLNHEDQGEWNVGEAKVALLPPFLLHDASPLHLTSCTLSPDHHFLIVTTMAPGAPFKALHHKQTILVYNLLTMTLHASLTGLPQSRFVIRAALSPQYVMEEEEEGEEVEWSSHSPSHPPPHHNLSYSPSLILASGSEDSLVHLWEVSSESHNTSLKPSSLRPPHQAMHQTHRQGSRATNVAEGRGMKTTPSTRGAPSYLGGATPSFLGASSPTGPNSSSTASTPFPSTPMTLPPSHSSVINDVAWHPHIPFLLASASDDHSVRLWSPHQL